MRRAAAILALGLLVGAIASTPAALAGRHHRLRLPAAELPRSLTVDESEWALRASKTVVGAGLVRIRAYNRGQDDHNLLLVAKDGTPYVVDLKPGDAGTITARLAPGAYTLICSLFAATPESHEARGMRASLTVR